MAGMWNALQGALDSGDTGFKARSYAVRAKARPRGGPNGLPISQVCQLMGLQRGMAAQVASPQIAIIELGGGYNLQAINSALQAEGLPPCTVRDVSVQGAVNSYSGDPNSADVEVMLDLYVAAGIYSYMTGKPANIVMIFCPNTGSGFVQGVQAAAGIPVCSVSWGGPESPRDRAWMQEMDAAFAAGVAKGTTFNCASGDNGSTDGTSQDVTDYPACSPYVVACGGTSWVLNSAGTAIQNESVWNHDGGAGGGGFSKIEPVPAWQQGFVPAGATGRGSPDLCSLADPQPGYAVPVFGAVGGTSAVAPLMAGFFAAVAGAKGQNLGLVNPSLYANEPAFFDVVAGNNGDYSAGKGYDEATGLGSLRSTVYSALLAGTPPPVTPPPVNPPPVNPPPVNPISGLQQAIDAYLMQLAQRMPGWSRIILWIKAAVDHWFLLNPSPVGSIQQILQMIFTWILPQVPPQYRWIVQIIGEMLLMFLGSGLGNINSGHQILGLLKEQHDLIGRAAGIGFQPTSGHPLRHPGHFLPFPAV
jgi:hypothetical protein